MSRLSTASRVARAIAELGSSTRSRMPFCIVGGVEAGYNDYAVTMKTVAEVATAIGHHVVTVDLPIGPGASVAAVGRTASNDMSHATTPTLVYVMASQYDGGDDHKAIIRGAAHLAAESWSMNGDTVLLVVAERREEIARLIGEELKLDDWAAAISL